MRAQALVRGPDARLLPRTREKSRPQGSAHPSAQLAVVGTQEAHLPARRVRWTSLEGVGVNPSGSRGPAPKPLAHLEEGVSGDKETDPGSQLLWFLTAHGSPGPSETPVQGPQEGGRDSLGLMGGRETGRMDADPSAVPASIPLPRSAPGQALGQRGWS